MKKRWRDGTHALVFDPLSFVGRLLALVPPPGFHLTRFHGVLAPAAAWRSEVLGTLYAPPRLAAQLTLFEANASQAMQPAPNPAASAEQSDGHEGRGRHPWAAESTSVLFTQGSQQFEQGRFSRGDRREKFRIDAFDCNDGFAHLRAASGCDRDGFGAWIIGVGSALHQACRFQCAHDLRRGHDIDSRELGQTCLGERLVGTEPGRRSQQHELRVRELESLQPRALSTLPSIRDFP
jgi:hypothetical protein